MTNRVGNLLLIVLFFSIYLSFKNNNVVEKVIGFFNKKSLRTRLVILFLLSQVIFIAASTVIVLKGVELVGDEANLDVPDIESGTTSVDYKSSDVIEFIKELEKDQGKIKLVKDHYKG